MRQAEHFPVALFHSDVLLAQSDEFGNYTLPLSFDYPLRPRRPSASVPDVSARRGPAAGGRVFLPALL